MAVRSGEAKLILLLEPGCNQVLPPADTGTMAERVPAQVVPAAAAAEQEAKDQPVPAPTVALAEAERLMTYLAYLLIMPAEAAVRRTLAERAGQRRRAEEPVQPPVTEQMPSRTRAVAAVGPMGITTPSAAATAGRVS